MRALSHCDFCGADAAGTFELLPPELEPTESEQRRVVLCRECGTRLEDLLEPLLARAGVDSTESTSSATGSSSATESPDTDGNDLCEDEAEAVDEAARSGVQNGRPAVIDVDEAKTEARTDESRADERGTDESETNEQDTENDRGVTLERSVGSEPAVSEASSEDPPSRDGDSSTDEGADSSNAGDQSTASTSSPPQAYRKVVRLLRNREFPMERSAVETLAAGAYDLERHEVEAIVEYALEDGEFVEDGDQLVRS